MKRIMPEEVLQAFKDTGLKPMQGAYFPENGCACGLGAILKSKYGLEKNESNNVCTYTVDMNYGREYRCGFANGFDRNIFYATTIEMKKGYQDGTEAWELVSKELL